MANLRKITSVIARNSTIIRINKYVMRGGKEEN